MRRALPALGAALAVAGLLTGCGSSPVGSRVTPHPRATATRAVSPATTPASPGPTQDPRNAVPVAVPCAELVPLTVVRELGPGYAPVDGFVPTRGTPAARLGDIHGTVCAWRDASTGHLLQVAVAHPSPADDLALKDDLVERSNSVPTYREEGYFQVVGKVGEADAFRGPNWIFATSPDLYEPGDAADLMHAVGLALKQRGI